MREIKFRAWYAPEKKMVGWGFIKRELNHYDKPFKETTDWKPMQYTGLKDSNGREIYEGDVLARLHASSNRWRRHTTVIWFSGVNHCGWNIASGANSCKVIGNIYENPELLN